MRRRVAAYLRVPMVFARSASAAWVAGRSALEIFEKGGDAPEKHSGVPENLPEET